jgi:hypothetical protein
VIPERCAKCQAAGNVTLEQTIKGQVVELAWCCGACSHSWPVKDGEITPVERRAHPGDRRKASRTNRRTR